jgi:hypothetical protein
MLAVHRKSGKKFTDVREKLRKLFLSKYLHALPTNTNYSPHLKIRTNSPKTRKFSDVIAIEGHYGHLQAVSLKNQPEVSKSDALKTLLNCRIKSLVNRLFSRNTPLKSLFF